MYGYTDTMTKEDFLWLSRISSCKTRRFVLNFLSKAVLVRSVILLNLLDPFPWAISLRGEERDGEKPMGGNGVSFHQSRVSRLRKRWWMRRKLWQQVRSRLTEDWISLQKNSLHWQSAVQIGLEYLLARFFYYTTYTCSDDRSVPYWYCACERDRKPSLRRLCGSRVQGFFYHVNRIVIFLSRLSGDRYRWYLDDYYHHYLFRSTIRLRAHMIDRSSSSTSIALSAHLCHSPINYFMRQYFFHLSFFSLITLMALNLLSNTSLLFSNGWFLGFLYCLVVSYGLRNIVLPWGKRPSDLHFCSQWKF